MLATARTRHVGDERGLTTTELAVLMPLLIVLVFFPIQVAVFWHARGTANLAAEEGVAAATIDGVDPEVEGRAAALGFLSQTGYLGNVVVDVIPSATTVQVEVRGDPRFAILPWSSTVVARAEAPIEQFTTPGA